jgi:uncharacterized caspase-like protein
MRLRPRFLLGVFFVQFVVAMTTIAHAAKVALVIGNGSYDATVPLPNPVNDARLVSAKLEAAGFDVIQGLDLDKAAMIATIDRFTEASFNAEVALIYYAGHGIQVEGKNYLLPVDAELTMASHLKTRAIDAGTLIAALPSEPAVGIVILDACRDNPISRTLALSLPKSRAVSISSGLAPVAATGPSEVGGLLIAYSTDQGSVALDGKGPNSPYAAALAKYLTEPGREIQAAFMQVRNEVIGTTLGKQRPWINASLGKEVFLGGGGKPGPAAAPAAESSRAADEKDADWVERLLWEEASRRNTVPHFEAYLAQFPQGRFAAIARLNIDALGKAPEPDAQVSRDGPDLTLGSTSGTIATEAALGLDKARLIDLQRRLEALEYQVGQADGVLGPKSRDAIARWQRASGFEPTTFLTADQYEKLVTQSEPLMAAIEAYERRTRVEPAPAKKPVRQQERKTQPAKKSQQAASQTASDTPQKKVIRPYCAKLPEYRQRMDRECNP